VANLRERSQGPFIQRRYLRCRSDRRAGIVRRRAIVGRSLVRSAVVVWRTRHQRTAQGL